MKKQLPKYYVIKRDESNPLWKKYIDWLNETYNEDWDGNIDGCFYGYDGSSVSGTNMQSDIKYFDNNPTLITLKFWDECVNGRKIVGYKAPFDMFCGDVKKGALYVGKANENGYSRKGFEDNAVYYLPKEIVETWEAVYEEEKLEVDYWHILECDNNTHLTVVNIKGKLTQEKVDKIKEVINE